MHVTPAAGHQLAAVLAVVVHLQDDEVVSPSAAEDADSNQLPLLGKKAGIRDAGFIFVGRKSWWVGLVLVVVSGLVLSVTVLTAILD